MGSSSHIIIVGAGVVGSATAYYLSKRESCKVTIIEKESICAGTSGVAGGMIASNWNAHMEHADEISKISFDLHHELAKEMDGAKNYGFRPMNAYAANFGQEGEALDKATREFFDTYGVKPEDVDLDNKPVDWVNPPISMKKISTEESTAQLTPEPFVRALLKEAEKTGRVEILQGKGVSELIFQDLDCQGVILEDGTKVKADKVIVAMGPWSGQLSLPYGKLPIKGWRWNTLLFEHDAPAGSVFHNVAYNSKAFVGDIYSRPDGTTYMCGEADDVTLPRTPKEARITNESINDTLYQVGMISKEVRNSRILSRQSGYIPMTGTGNPFIGPQSPYSNLYVGIGHGLWGILQAPITGKMLSEWVLDGKFGF
ncbi:FAD dependent oxidoreductase [Sporodiniella umbellata]|nr:FAD dependent oxidoreductase [Sporodiniella umbellata]